MGRRVCIRELDPDQTQTLQITSDQKYLWDGAELLEKRTVDGGTVLQRFFQQGFVDTDGTVLFYSRDHLGSIRELTDGTQAIRARYDYDPFGNMTKNFGDRDSAFGYAGYLWHAQSNLNLTWFREYDPRFGRWISRDPIEEKDGFNLYTYVRNNPMTHVDLLGLSCAECWDNYFKSSSDYLNQYKTELNWIARGFATCMGEAVAVAIFTGNPAAFGVCYSGAAIGYLGASIQLVAEMALNEIQFQICIARCEKKDNQCQMK
jgi:RHS repeat-associated protein